MAGLPASVGPLVQDEQVTSNMQHRALVVLTGLPAEDCSAFGVACSETGISWVHQPADAVLGGLAAGLAEAQSWVFWLYRAPWCVLPGVPRMDAWLALHSQLLRQRQDFGRRLVMVNIDAEQPHRILEVLGLLDGDRAVSQGSAASPRADAGLSTLMAKVFDWAAPEYWDVFEALEAAAPDTGRLPLFRSMLNAPLAEDILALKSLVVAGVQMPERQLALAAAQEALARCEVDREELRSKLERLTTTLVDAEDQVALLRVELRDQDAASVRQLESLQAVSAEREQAVAECRALQSKTSNELQEACAALAAERQLSEQRKATISQLEGIEASLRLQAERLTLELDQAVLAKRQQAVDAESSQVALSTQIAALQAQVDQQARQIEADVVALAAEADAAKKTRGELARLQPELAAALSSGEKLVTELAERNSELVRWRDAAAQAQADLTAQSHVLKQAQAAQKQLRSDLQASANALAAAQQQAEQVRAENGNLESERQLLLLQVHQGQGELEMHLSARRQLADQAERAKADAAKQLAGLRAEIKQQDGQLRAGEAALAREIETGQVLRDELGRHQAQLAAAQAQGKRLTTDLKSRDESLNLALSEAATIRSDLEAVTESLRQAEAGRHQLNKDLQAGAAALAAAQQLAEQGRTKCAALQGENELLLLQLHQVHEDLERGFLDNRRLQSFAAESLATMDRARKLLSKLMPADRPPSAVAKPSLMLAEDAT